MGKRIVFGLETDLWLVLHSHDRRPAALARNAREIIQKYSIAAFEFPMERSC